MLLEISVCPVQPEKMNQFCCLFSLEVKTSALKCPICGKTMNKHGYSSSGKQRWRCKKCSYTKMHKINTDAKNLELFLAWLFSKQRQVDMPGGGRAFRYKTVRFWEIWPMPPLIDEIFDVVYVDGIHLGRKAFVLIACSDKYVLGWCLFRFLSCGKCIL